MTTEIKNKRASFDYILSNRLTAGIVLYGTEIKSIREGKASLADTYCLFIGNELWIKNMQISAYRLGTFYNHDVKRDRKLLLTKRELRKFQRATKETGYTIIPVRLFIAENGFAKLEIALARGKKAYDKRQTLKENDARREMRDTRTL
ncbi:MAG: SsrA-binding protein SmpB [Paludibacteraceae bacterium]|nr:SsrA-binding protein SmpB [Paludibacteraceae bacterium]